MVVCKYFLTDSCHYGSRCRFEHPPQEYTPNPYVYDVRQKAGAGVSVLQRNTQAPVPNYSPTPRYNNSYNAPRYSSPHSIDNRRTDDLREYLEMMVKEVNQVENEHMWPLTSVGILKGNGNIPGWIDYSPEELRWEAYKCEKEKKFEDYVMGVKTLLNKAKELRSIFVRPTKMGESVLREYLKQSSFSETSPGIGIVNNLSTQPFFSNISGQQNNALNTFSFALNQDKPTSPLNQPPHTASNFNFGSAFNSVSPGATNFGSQQSSIFGQPLQQGNIMNPFQNESSMNEEPVFDKGNSVFSSPGFVQPQYSGSGKSVTSSTLDVDDEARTYTNINQLSQQDVEQFQANTFTINHIPIKPPPKELCRV